MSSNSSDNKPECLDKLIFPKTVGNRPGLSHVEYRMADFGSFREFLLRKLSENGTLDEWTYRGSDVLTESIDDPGIALLEGAARIGDILTFYQELYVNEAFIKTACWRESVADLVRLVGYRLSPGLGGEGTFAFKISGDKTVTIPSGFPLTAQLTYSSKKVNFETSEELTAYPALSEYYLYQPKTKKDKIRKNDKKFCVKTSDLTDAGVELKEDDRLMFLDKTHVETPNARIVVIEEVKEEFDNTIITIKGGLQIEGEFDNLWAYKLGRTFHHFGHNAPPKVAKSSGYSVVLEDISYLRRLDSKTPGEKNKYIDPSFAAKDFPLDSEVPDLAEGSSIIVQGFQSLVLKYYTKSSRIQESTKFVRPGDTVVRKANSIRKASMTWGALTGACSIVRMNADLSISLPEDNNSKSTDRVHKVRSADSEQSHLDEIQMKILSDERLYSEEYGYEIRVGAKSMQEKASQNAVDILQKDLLKLAEDISQWVDVRKLSLHETTGSRFRITAIPEVETTTPKNRLVFYGEPDDYKVLNNRQIAFISEDGCSWSTTAYNDEVMAQNDTKKTMRMLRLSDNLPEEFTPEDFSWQDPTIKVYGNLAAASQGKTETDIILGNGDSRETFQTFKLPKTPLTYLTDSEETPPEKPELKIYVANILWERVESFFGHNPKEQIYIIREDNDNNSWVQFGDGKTGARLPSGIDNIVATYRVGSGAYGAIEEETKVNASNNVKHLDEIYLPGVVSGGADSESGDSAKAAAPGKVQALGRLVTLYDYEHMAQSIAGVARATAGWMLRDDTPHVVITVLMLTGRADEYSDVQEKLQSYDVEYGTRRYPLLVQEGGFVFAFIKIKYGLNPIYRSDVVETAIHSALGTISGKNSEPAGTGLFALSQRRFGQSEYAHRIEGTVQNVGGVLWAIVEKIGLFPVDNGDDPSELEDSMMIEQQGNKLPCDSSSILSLCKDHLVIEAVSSAAQGEKS